jgi:hypothetical protein
MEVCLFHADTHARLRGDKLRERAREEVQRSKLIKSAGVGDRDAAIALHIGFWPFVREFEIAIDQRPLPRQPLAAKFGQATMHRCFLGLARAVREMKDEEGSHAAHWQQDAQNLEIQLPDSPIVPGVRELIESAYVADLVQFFGVLAGTEFIAEELSSYLTRSERFVSLFPGRRWAWGDVHLLPHEAGPSHLEIDLDLARAYSPLDDIGVISRAVENTIALFGRAAVDVAQFLIPLKA